jgi:fructokinase
MLTVLGEALIDLVADPDGRYTAHAGGSPLNVAVGLARLGQASELMARLSTDAFGRLLRGHAAGNGVGLTASPRVTEPTTLAVVSLDREGRADYAFYLEGTADWQWTEAELELVPAETRIFHTGSLASWTAPGAQRISDLTSRLRAHGDVVLSYDPNIRPLLLADLDAARRLVERSVSDAHVVKCSEEDLAYLYPEDSVESVLERWLNLRCDLVVVTRGGDGVIARTRDALIERPGVPIELVDTIGAGDAFMAGLLAGLTDLGLTTPAKLAAASSAEFATVIDTGTLVAALTCERAGAQPPTRAELDTARPRLAVAG